MKNKSMKGKETLELVLCGVYTVIAIAVVLLLLNIAYI